MNPYALPPLIGLVLSLALGAYVFTRDTRGKLNRIFFTFAAFLALSALGEFMRLMDTGLASPDFWSIVENAGLIFVGPLVLHFTSLLHAMTNPAIFKKRYFWWVIYGAGGIFLVLLLTGNLIGKTTLRYWGYDYGYLPVYYFFTTYLLWLSLGAIIRMFTLVQQLESDDLLRKQVRLILGGAVMLICVGSATDIALSLSGVHAMSTLSIFLLVFEGSVGYALLKHRPFTPPPRARFLRPAPESKLKTKLRYKLVKGRSYLIKEDSGLCIKIFIDQVTHGIPGLWITSLRSRDVEKYGFRRTPVLFLADKTFPGQLSLSPNELGRVKVFVENHLFMAGERSVVMIDCFKEFVKVNGFKRVLECVQELKKICQENDSNLIVRVDLSECTEKQLKAVEKVLRPLD